MSNVTLDIAGHSFTIACAEGEEDHVLMLGRMIDEKLGQMPNVSGQSETRMLLFSSLLLADELHELKFRQETSPSPPPASAAAAPGPVSEGPPDLPERLEHLAHKFENLAALLERQPPKP